MKTILKFPLEYDGTEQALFIPTGAKLLKVDEQHGKPTLWFELDPDAETEKRKFAIYGTGWPMSSSLIWMGTFFSGDFVWHIYEVTR